MRDRQRTLRVVVSAGERARIEGRAKNAGLSVSAYLRAAGLNQPIRSVLDHAAVMELAKINGDQGRLGGLLKLWLVERTELAKVPFAAANGLRAGGGQGVPEIEIRRLLDGIGELQAKLAEIAGRV